MSLRRAIFVPLRVVIQKGSRAAELYKKAEGLHPDALAPGLTPSPEQDLKFRGGKTIQDLNFINFYVAGQSAWDANEIQKIDTALSAAMSDTDLNNVMMQYFGNQPITSTFAGSRQLAGDAPAVVSQGDTEALVASLNDNRMLAGLDLSSTLVNLLLPPGTILTTDPSTSSEFVRTARVRDKRVMPHDDEASSLNGLGGYHGSVHVGGVAGAIIYYAVGVYSEALPDGSQNGIPVFNENWKNVVATFYHELNEARTDPDVEDAIRTGDTSVLGWTSDTGEECGDFPVDEAGQGGDLSLVFQEVPLTSGSGTVPVQFQYSNAVHGPEGPIEEPH